MMVVSLVNHLWQTTWFAVAAAVLAWILRRHAARVRFGVWLAASLKSLVPFGALTALGARLPWVQAHAVAPAAVALNYETMVVPMSAAPLAAAPSPRRRRAGRGHGSWVGCGWRAARCWRRGGMEVAEHKHWRAFMIRAGTKYGWRG